MFKRLFDNNWFVSIISLFSAILLTLSVSNTNTINSSANQNTNASIESSVTISNVPVQLGDHEEGTFVSGMPETVSVRLTGPRNIINQLSVENFVVKTESLIGAQAGNRSIRFEAEGLPESVEYKVTPDLFYGKISTKETMDVDLTYELADNVIGQGYMAGNISLDVQQVTLSGSSDEMAKVDQVKVVITADQPQTATFSQSYRVQVLDKDGKPLDINISQDQVTVTVEVLPTTAQLPVEIVPTGEQEGYSYSYSLVGNGTVQVSGQASSAYISANLYIDVSQLTQSATVTGYFETMEGLILATNSMDVQVTVTANQASTSETTVPIDQETTSAEETEETTTTQES